MTLTTGFYLQGAPLPADWNAVPALSYSIAKVLLDSTPLHAWAQHRLLGAKEEEWEPPTDAQARGIVIDSLILGVDQSRLVVIDAPDYRTKAAQQQRDLAYSEKKQPVIKAKLDELKKVADILKDKIGNIWGVPKLRVAWLSDGDVYCHGELDAFNEAGVGEDLAIPGLDPKAPVILDLKSCSDAVEAASDRKIYDLAYQLQHGAYLDAIACLRPGLADRVQYVLVFAEITYPYDVRFVMLDPSFADMGRGQWARAVHTWRQCMRNRRWPGSTRQIHRVGAPLWAQRKEATAFQLAAARLTAALTEG